MSGKVEKICKDEESHKGDISCLTFVNGFLFSGGQDGSVKIWDENLSLKRNLDIFGASTYINALCVDVNSRLYVAGSNGVVKCLPGPLTIEASQEIHNNANNPVQALFCHAESVWAGDNVGNLYHIDNFQITQRYEMAEEIKGLAVDDKLIYTIRDNDLCVSEIIPDKGLYTVKAVIPGKSPVKLVGAYVNAKRSLIATVTRDGKGINVLNNCPHRDFVQVWHKDNAHDTIINSLSGNENSLFTASYNGTVRWWTNINDVGKLSGEINVGSSINSICHGPNDHTVYVGTSDGKVRKVIFS